jgi:hypothetical protein
MTPQEILELSEPLEAVYTDTVTQLIANICKRLGEGKELPNWQAKKLAELDALTDESIQIISRMTGRRDAEIRNAISKALNIELNDVEAVLTGAAAAGAIAGIGFTVEESQGLKSMAQALIDQAETRANLVNTVMLNSTRQRYIWAVNSTADREQKLIEQLYSARNYEELEAQLSKVQAALNKAAGTVEVGAEARVQALSRTVKELAQEGITGYIDRGGHHWSPEAYMNMDIRTTVHNTAVQAQKTRAEEYGVETFQISSHGGARPLCAPYQGKFYSWDGSSGVVHDLRGNEYIYESIYDTSYGEPAGIFGINCGHNPQTFVDGYNIPRYEETSDFEANAEEYRESQKQRYFEREVRQAKLEAIAQDAAGNKDAFDKAAAKVRQANANYKEFCKETGRTPRPDRLQVFTSTDSVGYDRRTSGKVSAATRGFKPKEAKSVQQPEQPKVPRVDETGAMRGVPRIKIPTPQEAAVDVNPLYKASSLYRENCANCVVAEELRIRGYAVTADLKDYSTKISSYWDVGGYGRGSWTDSFVGGIKPKYIGANRKPQQVPKIQAIMDEWGKNSRAVVFVQWDGHTIGHYFTAVNTENGVVFINPQHPEDDAVEYFKTTKPSATALFRVDDKGIDEFARRVVRWNEKKQ